METQRRNNKTFERIICSRCVMDKSAPETMFDENGVCNFCHQAQQSLKEIERDKDKLPHLIKVIKDQENTYDCIIGLSGGVDSAFALHKAVELGLKPLCFSVDNGWQSPKAQENIMKLVEGMRVPFYRYKIDLGEFRDIQSAFIKAGQRNLEIPTDHILMAATYDMARQYNSSGS